MNRGIALFVCLAALVAHSLAIFTDGTGAVAPTYDRAYAAFRMSWQFVHEGLLRWNQTGPAFESYPSLAWCLWIALGERLQLSPNVWSQFSGMVAALASVIFLSRFHVDRIASLIGPVLLVASGGVAAAAISGTETTSMMLAVTAAFLAFEKGWRVWLGVALVALCAIRPEGAWIAGAMFALELAGARASARGGGAGVRWAPFGTAAATVAIIWIVRSATTGHVLSPLAAQILTPDDAQWRDGLVFVRDFFLSGPSPLLLVVPLACLCVGRLPVTGRHALVLSAVWIAITVLRGGGALPFCEVMVPALPLVFHAVQEGLTPAIHSLRGYVRRPAIALLLAALALSALASSFPSERGPLPIGDLHEAWMHSTRATRPEYEEVLGRAGLIEEIRRTQRLRAIGLYLRDSVDPDATVLTAWPGSIAYLSRLTTWDALGRANPRPGQRRPASWERPARVDMAAWLEREPDYVVPMLAIPRRAPTREDIARTWILHLDDGAGDEERVAELVAALEPYELITVPASVDAIGTDRQETLTPYLLRRRDLELQPTLEAHVRGQAFSVRVRNRGHEQLANLMVIVEDADGGRWSMRPTGEFVREGSTYARANLLLYVSGHPVELVRASVAELVAQGVRPVRLRAVLLNLGCDEVRDLAVVAGPITRPM